MRTILGLILWYLISTYSFCYLLKDNKLDTFLRFLFVVVVAILYGALVQ